MEKTNVMRILDQKNIFYHVYEYPHEDKVAIDGVTVANLLGEDPQKVFKTLVTIGSSKHYYVFLVPVLKELDLKLCAKAVKEKSIELIPVKDLLALTGYMRGGCSPIGMKKQFKTVVDVSALEFDFILFSAGKIGLQIEMNPKDFNRIFPTDFLFICK